MFNSSASGLRALFTKGFEGSIFTVHTTSLLKHEKLVFLEVFSNMNSADFKELQT